MLIGYTRSRRSDTELASQIQKLEKVGCLDVYSDIGNPGNKDLPNLKKLLEDVSPGDTIVVPSLLVFGKRMAELIKLVLKINDKQVYLISLKEHINSDSVDGKLLFELLEIFVTCDNKLKKEFSQVGLDAAKLYGRKGGRPKGFSKESKEKAKKAAELYEAQKLTISDILKVLKISKATFYNYLKMMNVELFINRRKKHKR